MGCVGASPLHILGFISYYYCELTRESPRPPFRACARHHRLDGEKVEVDLIRSVDGQVKNGMLAQRRERNSRGNGPALRARERARGRAQAEGRRCKIIYSAWF
jgi:hypothetical protein